MLAGCAGAASHDPGRDVSIGEWCSTTATALATELGGRCQSGPVFAAAFEKVYARHCPDGRKRRATSGRNGGDLGACLAKIRELECNDLALHRTEACQL